MQRMVAVDGKNAKLDIRWNYGGMSEIVGKFVSNILKCSWIKKYVLKCSQMFSNVLEGLR